MAKLELNKTVFFCLYGYPGSGKSYLARNLSETLGLASVSADRIRSELFEHPRFDAQENAIVDHLMRYMSEEFLNAEVSTVYDASADRIAQRRALRDLAKRCKAEYYLIWLQTDEEHAFAQTQKRDMRKTDDKYAQPQTRLSFDKQILNMQNPQNENYIVVSGKHTFTTQKNAILSRLFQDGLLHTDAARSQIAKPGLVNLVPNPASGRVDYTRRNIKVS